MKFPRTKQIGGFTWRLYYAKKMPEWVELDEGEAPPLGYSCFKTYRIWVSKTGSEQEDQESYIHESLVLHASPCCSPIPVKGDHDG